MRASQKSWPVATIGKRWQVLSCRDSGAGEGTRTLDVQLGKPYGSRSNRSAQEGLTANPETHETPVDTGGHGAPSDTHRIEALADLFITLTSAERAQIISELSANERFQIARLLAAGYGIATCGETWRTDTDSRPGHRQPGTVRGRDGPAARD